MRTKPLMTLPLTTQSPLSVAKSPFVLSFMLLPALVACAESVESSDVLTSGIYADYAVTATNDNTATTKATLKVGGGLSNTFVELDGDDALTVTSRGETKTLGEKNIGEMYWYEADWPLAAEAAEFVFAFVRTVDDGAPESTVTLPASFSIDAPTAAFIIKRGTDDLTVTWSPSGSTDSMSIAVRGDCIENVSETVSDDPGTYTFSADRIVTKEDKESDSCEGTVELTRTRTGSLDEAFEEGGRVVAEQIRSVKIRLDP
jgi:hypothetical protein